MGVNGNNDVPPLGDSTTVDARRFSSSDTNSNFNPPANLSKLFKFGTNSISLQSQGMAIGNPNVDAEFATKPFTFSTKPSILQQKYMDIDKSFTVDFWYYMNGTVPTASCPIAEYRFFRSRAVGGVQEPQYANGIFWQLTTKPLSTTSAYIYLKSSHTKVGTTHPGMTTYAYSTTMININTWNHIAITYDSATTKMVLYVGGVPSVMSLLIEPLIPQSGLSLFLGGSCLTASFDRFSNTAFGWIPIYSGGTILFTDHGTAMMDEFRISQGIKYTAKFTPPTVTAKSDLGPPAKF